jgi:WD40 repeat protein
MGTAVKSSLLLSLYLLLLTLSSFEVTAEDCPLLPPVRSPLHTLPITENSANQVSQIDQLGHGLVNQITWSPDGKTLALATSVGVWLYNMDSKDSPPLLMGNCSEWITSITFSSDGSILAVGTQNLGFVRLWKVRDKSLSLTISTERDS